jgi:hypothetical protein
MFWSWNVLRLGRIGAWDIFGAWDVMMLRTFWDGTFWGRDDLGLETFSS